MVVLYSSLCFYFLYGIKLKLRYILVNYGEIYINFILINWNGSCYRNFCSLMYLIKVVFYSFLGVLKRCKCLVCKFDIGLKRRWVVNIMKWLNFVLM